MTLSHHAHQAAGAFEDAVSTGEAALRQQRRHHAVLRGFGGVKGLAHRAEYLAHAARLCPGDGECVDHLLLCELEQTTCCGCGTEHAAGVGDMPMRRSVPEMRVNHQTDATSNLDADGECGEKIFSIHRVLLA